MPAKQKYLSFFCVTFCLFLLPTELIAQGETDRVSISSSGIEGDDFSQIPATSRYGTHVAFESRAGNLVTGDTNGLEDIFVHDRLTGITMRSSVDSAGVQGNSRSENPSISACGRFVAFESWANNLVPRRFQQDRRTSSCTDHHTGQTERVSVELDGQGSRRRWPGSPHFGGRPVRDLSFRCQQPGGRRFEQSDGCLRARSLPGPDRARQRGFVGQTGQTANSMEPSISADGRYVAFQSWADNLVPGDTNYDCDVFVHDLNTGQTVRASVDSTGVEADDWSKYPGISGNGRYVALPLQCASTWCLATRDGWMSSSTISRRDRPCARA